MKVYSLVDAARILQIPQRHVFSLYSAAYTIGLAGSAKRSVDMLFKPELINTNIDRELYQKIVDDLG